MDLRAFNVLSLFSGGGGLDVGVKLAVPSARTVCYVEREAYAAGVLVARMEEARMDAAPVWSDISTFDGSPWRGAVDCIAGGFPCQDISSAGARVGISGEKSGLWREFARIVHEVRPWLVFVENVADLTARGLDVVLGDLAGLGFDAEWCVLRASDVGAKHRRRRVFILAHAGRERLQGLHRAIGDLDLQSTEGTVPRIVGEATPRIHRATDGDATWVDRIRLLGNGVVPQQAAHAFELLCRRIVSTTAGCRGCGGRQWPGSVVCERFPHCKAA